MAMLPLCNATCLQLHNAQPKCDRRRASMESLLIPERQNEGKSSDVADSMNRHHGLCLGVLR